MFLCVISVQSGEFANKRCWFLEHHSVIRNNNLALFNSNRFIIYPSKSRIRSVENWFRDLMLLNQYVHFSMKGLNLFRAFNHTVTQWIQCAFFSNFGIWYVFFAFTVKFIWSEKTTTHTTAVSESNFQSTRLNLIKLPTNRKDVVSLNARFWFPWRNIIPISTLLN